MFEVEKCRNARLTPERDRSSGLRIFGAIQIAAGVLFAGMSFLVLAGRFVTRNQTAEPVTVVLPKEAVPGLSSGRKECAAQPAKMARARGP